MANTLGIRIVRPVTLRKFQQPEIDLSKQRDTSSLSSSERARSPDEKSAVDSKRCKAWNAPTHSQSQPSTVERSTQTYCADDLRHTEFSIRSIVTDDRADVMPVSSTLTYSSMHKNNQNFSHFDRDGQKSMDYPVLGGTLTSSSTFNGIKQTGYDVYSGEFEYRSGALIPRGDSGGGGVGSSGESSGPVVKQGGSLVDDRGPKEAPIKFGSSKDTYSKMTRAVTQKPEGIGESLAWLKRELMELRNTDQELTRTLFTLQSKIRDLKNKINQDEADDDDDDSEKTDYPSSWSSNGHRSDSFSAPSSQKTKGVNIIKEENEEEPVMEVKQVTQKSAAVTVTRTAVKTVNAVNTRNTTAVNGNTTNGDLINGTAVNHNANGYSRNTNNSLDQTVRPPSLRKSVTSDGLKNYSNLEKPNLPPPPPPPASSSPTPSRNSTSSNEVVHRFALKEESKRDSMSSSSFVSSSSSFASSLEDLPLQDDSRGLRSSGRSFDRLNLKFEEEEEEEEESQDLVNDGSVKDNEPDVDDNGNEETTSNETSEASRMMESIWAEVAMFS